MISFREATPDDAAEVAQVYLTSRKAFVSFAPIAHTESEVTQWIAATLIPSGRVTVAIQDNVIVGMMALEREHELGWIDQLYMAPAAVGQGIGSRMVERAKAELGSPIRLYTFQANAGARRFYERHGFLPIAFGDGQENEEKCPDVLYEWSERA